MVWSLHILQEAKSEQQSWYLFLMCVLLFLMCEANARAPRLSSACIYQHSAMVPLRIIASSLGVDTITNSPVRECTKTDCDRRGDPYNATQGVSWR